VKNEELHYHKAKDIAVKALDYFTDTMLSLKGEVPEGAELTMHANTVFEATVHKVIEDSHRDKIMVRLFFVLFKEIMDKASSSVLDNEKYEELVEYYMGRLE